MEDYLTIDSAPTESSISQESLQCLAEFSADDNHRGSERFLYSGSSLLRNCLAPPLQAHPRACLSSNSITSCSSTASASSFSVSSESVNHDHRLQSMQHGNIYAARRRTSAPVSPRQGNDRSTKGGATAVVGSFGSLAAHEDTGSDPHLTKIVRAGRSYHCRMCDQEFENKSDMQRHAKEIHRLDEKGHCCSKCLKSFPSSQQLAQHSLVHTNIRKYPCRFCDKAFKQLSHVQQHQRIHTGERPYRCTVDSCAKAFRQLSSLQQHIKGHNVPLPKSYMISPNCASLAARAYKTTDQIHSDVARPHDLTCQVCEKQCLDEVRFFEHIHKYHPDYWRVFSSGRPLSDFIDFCHRETTLFTCSICHRTFSQETVYWKHMMTHSTGLSAESEELRMYDCTICCKLFTKESYLLRHLEMKLDAEHSARLEEFKKSGAMFHLATNNCRNPYSVAPLLDQITNGSESRNGKGGSGGGGGGGERKPSPVQLMPPKAHGSSFSPVVYPGIYPFNASRSFDYQTDCYNRLSSMEHRSTSLFEPDPAVVKQEIVGRFPEEEDDGIDCQSSDLRVSRSALPGSSGPESPVSLKSYLRDNQPGSLDFYRSVFSPPGRMNDRPNTPTTGLSLLNSSHTLFPNQLLTLTPSGFGLTRSAEPQRLAFEDQKPSPLNYHRAEPSPSFVQRFQPLGEGRSPPAFALTSPRPFAHSSVVSPSYGGLSQSQEAFRRPATHCFADAFQRRSETQNCVFPDVGCLRSASREAALQSYDHKLSQTVDNPKAHLTRSFCCVDSTYQPRFEPIGRDIHNYLRRSSLAEADVSMFLRRTDISDHIMANTVNHLARSITGLR